MYNQPNNSGNGAEKFGYFFVGGAAGMMLAAALFVFGTPPVSVANVAIAIVLIGVVSLMLGRA